MSNQEDRMSESERKRLLYMSMYRGNTLDRIKKLATEALTDGGGYAKQMALLDIIREVENGK